MRPGSSTGNGLNLQTVEPTHPVSTRPSTNTGGSISAAEEMEGLKAAKKSSSQINRRLRIEKHERINIPFFFPRLKN
jgi:hypothetical protein